MTSKFELMDFNGFTNKKILIVEDDDMLRGILLEQLASKYLIVPARDGEEALAQVSINHPDLILLDLLLPKLDGFGVLSRLRELPDPQLARTPVLVVSNLSDEASMERAREYNIEDYFAKANVNVDELIRRIEQVFRQESLPS